MTVSNEKIKIVFLGTPAFSTAALQALAQHPAIEIQAVVTQPDRPAGRGHKLTPPPVRTLAESLGLPVFQTASIKKDETLKQHLKDLKPDFLVTVAFGQILTQEVLDIPTRATVNAHASLLPEFRGANPIQQAILQGKSETGITTMLTELGVDTGPMLLKETVPIETMTTLGELTQQLSDFAGPLLVRTLTGMVDGSVKPQLQPHEQATHAPKCQKQDALLDWSEPADLLQRKIRAFNPAPGAVAFFEAERIKILTAKVTDAKAAANLEENVNSAEPGQILAMMDSGILVKTGSGLLEVRTLQPAAKKEMSARDWALGVFKPINGKRQLGCFTHAEQPTPQPA